MTLTLVRCECTHRRSHHGDRHCHGIRYDPAKVCWTTCPCKGWKEKENADQE